MNKQRELFTMPSSGSITIPELYEQQKEELLQQRLELLNEYSKIIDIDASNKYDKIELKRFQYHYLALSLGSVIALLILSRLYIGHKPEIKLSI